MSALDRAVNRRILPSQKTLDEARRELAELRKAVEEARNIAVRAWERVVSVDEIFDQLNDWLKSHPQKG